MARLWVVMLSAVTLVPAAAQDAGEKPKQPRFFFESGGALARPENAAKPAAAAAPAKPAELPAVAPRFDFETEGQLAYWHPADAEATLETVAQGAAGGKSCLRMIYTAREGAFEQLDARPLQVARGRTLRCSVQTDLPTPLSFGVVERDGAFYQQFGAIPGGRWVQIDLPLDSLTLSQDTQDADGKLDPTEIVGIRVADLSNLPGGLGDVLGRKTGVQRLLVDEVAIADEEAPMPGATAAGSVTADGFERDAIYALPIGGARLLRGEGARGAGLEITCGETHLRWVGLVMGVQHLNLATRSSLSLQLRAKQPVTLSLVLEERDGSKYSRRLKIEPTGQWTEQRLRFEELLLEPDSTDENGALDRDQIRVLVLVADAGDLPDAGTLAVGVDEVAFR